MDLRDYYSRDCYNLQFNRTFNPILYFPRGDIQEHPNDPYIVRITNLENALGDLIRKRNSLLNQESLNLGETLDEAQFLFERLKELNPVSILNSSLDVSQKKSFGHRYDAFNELGVLEKRKREALIQRDMLWKKLKNFLVTKTQTFQRGMGEYEDRLLYRVQVDPSSRASGISNKPSACRWRQNGYRCSGWNYFGEITNEDIRNHMNGVEVPTPLISVSESPARLMVFLKKAISNRDEDATFVEVISLQMLQHIGVISAPTPDLCFRRGIPTSFHPKEGHAQYVTETHWVIMHWIPKEAIIATMNVDRFHALASARNVIDDSISKNVLDMNYSIRFHASDVTQLSLAPQASSLQYAGDPMLQLSQWTGNLNLGYGNR